MTTATIELERRPWPLAADVIKDVGWVQGAMETQAGVCLTGAIKRCSPQPGDWVIYREVARHREHAEDWNDANDRTRGEVLRYLRRAAPITDDELLTVFGPQWEAVVALVRRAAVLTPSERSRFWKAVDKAWGKAAYQHARRAVVVYVGPGVAARRALRAFVDDAGYADVGAALARRHEIGQPGGIRQEDYDALCRPAWSQGWTVHPDDE